MAKRLIDAGINLTNIALIIAKLRRQPLEEFSHTFIMSDGHKVMECTDDMSIIDMMREGTAVFGLSVARLDEDLSARLRAFSPIRLDEEAVSSVTGRSLESVDHGPVLLARGEALLQRFSHRNGSHFSGWRCSCCWFKLCFADKFADKHKRFCHRFKC